MGWLDFLWRKPGSVASINPLDGKPLRYLIGTDASGPGRDDEVTVVSYCTTRPAKRGISIAYCNLFDEHNSGRYGPYLKASDTAAQYNEGQIDPRGPGWEKNLREQLERRRKQGFEYVELDNPDAYAIKDVIGAIELAAGYGLKVIAKNPLLMAGIEREEHQGVHARLRGLCRERPDAATPYVAHRNVLGAIVELDAGDACEMNALRCKAGKPALPVWFVFFGSGKPKARATAAAISKANFVNMGVTWSSAGEYRNAVDLLTPR